MTKKKDAPAPVHVGRRVTAILFLLALAVGASFVITSSLAELQSGTALQRPRHSELESSIADSADGTLAVDAHVGGRVVATYILTLPRTDPLVGLVENGSFAAAGIPPEEIFGTVDVNASGQYVPTSWGPVTTSVGPDSGLAQISANLTTPKSSLSTPTRLTFSLPRNSTLSLHTSDWSISAVSPVHGVAVQTKSSLTVEQAADSGGDLLEVTLASAARPPTSASDYSFGAQLGSFGIWLIRSVLVILPWSAFWLALRRWRGRGAWPAQRPRPIEWDRSGRIIVALALFLLVEGISWIDSAVYWATVPLQPAIGFWAGSPIAAATALLVVIAWGLWVPQSDDAPSVRWLPGLIAALIVLSAIAVVGGISLLYPLEPATDDVGRLGGARWVFGITAVVWAAVCIGLLTVFRARYRVWGGIASGASGLIAGAAQIGGTFPQVAEKILVAFIGAALLSLLTRYVVRAVDPGGPGWRAAAIAGAVGAAALLALLPRNFQDLGGAAFDAVTLGYILETVTGIALTVLITAGAISAGRAPRPWVWFAGAIIGGVVFLRWQALPAGVPLALLVGVPLFLWIAYRRWTWDGTLTGDPASIARDSSNFVDTASRRRLTRDYANAVRRKVASADATVDEAPPGGSGLLPSQLRAKRELGLGWGGTADAWQRAWQGTLVGLIVAFPLALPYFTSTLDQLSRNDGVRMLSGLIDIVFVFRFPLYGFAFGLLFPMLRGAGGMEKAVRLLIVLAITESVFILIPFNDSGSMRSALLLRLVQLLAVFISLGVWFDLRSLRTAGRGLDQLGDLYNVNRLTLWSSGAALTVLTAVLTSMLAPVATTLLHDLLPPKPPPATSVPVDGN
ncbi:hypothetical protein LK09_09560 [Microbacterium mangrovi]|uniref:Uncharacterized protein n=1 Tax=Microbacterium mangrovi TaxID=1348253 RepID=A0A0B2A2Q9_9MICO|nr:hypothetical protein [Microbacterium mangrovi]KHK97749.1 hypothetical protein LK09_09560 [Microbacterium mangrovi]